ncbi:hypothetical protein EYF80_002041 [Liparis tanakae]|uniref:Uncharacterized protein n=1 Tax=Liparis tanakae TaxID=230148 RepID=A0A4Z2JCZ8_9TELE|nr:hypothetical protein EYF80_002041 [Liparis tanakae]
MKTDIVQWSLKRVAIVEGFMKTWRPWTRRLPVVESCGIIGGEGEMKEIGEKNVPAKKPQMSVEAASMTEHLQRLRYFSGCDCFNTLHFCPQKLPPGAAQTNRALTGLLSLQPTEGSGGPAAHGPLHTARCTRPAAHGPLHDVNMEHGAAQKLEETDIKLKESILDVDLPDNK